jgi:hypothetical protein
VSDAKLARCPRCKAYALVAERQGLRVAVDIAPADALGFGHAVANGIDLYWAENVPGRPAKLLGRRSATQRPSWGQNGAQSGSQRLHAEHSCGAPARDMVILNVSAPKDQAPATPGAPGAGNLLHDALAAVARDRDSRSPAPSATPRRSRPPVCTICDRVIAVGELYYAVECPPGVYAWALHEECP